MTAVHAPKPQRNLKMTFMGFDEKGIVATGLGFGAEKGNEIIGEFLKDYEDISFILERISSSE